MKKFPEATPQELINNFLSQPKISIEDRLKEVVKMQKERFTFLSKT